MMKRCVYEAQVEKALFDSLSLEFRALVVERFLKGM